MKSFLRSLCLFAALTPIPALAQMPPPVYVPSIDILVLEKETVAVGTVREVRPGNDSDEIVIAVEEALKGNPQKTLRLKQKREGNDRAALESLSRMVRDNARVLVIGDDFTPLSGTRLAIPTAEGTLLRESKQVIARIQQVFRNHPAGPTASFNIPAPEEIQKATLHRFFDHGFRGPSRELRVPVDEQLEAWALKMIRSRDELYRAFQALRLFKSASNIEFVRRLYTDPAFDSYNSNGVELRIYRTRQYAYELLQFWKVGGDPPVVREEIPRFESLESFTLGIGPEDRFDKVAALSKNLKHLRMASSTRPSPEQLAKVGEMRSLERLVLNGPDKKVALRGIANLVNLEELELRSVGITDNDLAPLLSLPRLKALNFQGNRISDAGLKALAGIRTLKTLVVSGTTITPRGIAEVRALRPDLKIEQQ
jgi:hypothetical protein